jgi:hypothetical protein
MKKIIILCLCISTTGAILAMSVGNPAQRKEAFPAFWQKFKTAVIGGDRDAVAGFSRFPIGMSYGVRSIKNNVELRKRYRELFNAQTDAAKCFSKKSPEKDSGNPKRFSIACPNEAGEEVVVYEFEQTALGWKFVQLDNLNE